MTLEKFKRRCLSANMIGVGEFRLSYQENSDCYLNSSAMDTSFSDKDYGMKASMCHSPHASLWPFATGTVCLTGVESSAAFVVKNEEWCNPSSANCLAACLTLGRGCRFEDKKPLEVRNSEK